MTPEYGVAIADIVNGARNWDMWGRLGWREVKRRYRRTVVGPFWTTLSLAIFVVVLGVVWSRLWNQDPKTYLPYLTSGMLTWVMFSSFCTEGSATFFAAWNEPRRAIDHERSTIMTVAVCVSCSER